MALEYVRSSQVPASVLSDAQMLYQDLHRHPELSGQEQRTAGRLESWLADDGFEIRSGIGGHGFLATRTNGPGPHVALRTELDALPIAERTGLPYASTVVDPQQLLPVAHACGHDLHASAVVGAARCLVGSSADWSGTLSVLGQPAEETISGARSMLDDGVYSGPHGAPDVVLAQHTAPLPTGVLAHPRGAVFAASMNLHITVHAGGGHAGAPQFSVDPIVTAAAIVLRLQAVVSRETGPAEPIVVSVAQLHAGSGGNVLPETAELEVTVRAMRQDSLERVAAAVTRVARAECAASGCPDEPTIEVTARSPVTESDRRLTEVVRSAHTETVGTARVISWIPAMATEDVALFGAAGHSLHGRDVRLGYWVLGVTPQADWDAAEGDAVMRMAAQPPNHSAEFAPDPAALEVGIRAMADAALACFADEGNARQE